MIFRVSDDRCPLFPVLKLAQLSESPGEFDGDREYCPREFPMEDWNVHHSSRDRPDFAGTLCTLGALWLF